MHPLIRLILTTATFTATAWAAHAAEPSKVEAATSAASTAVTRTGEGIKKGGEKVEGLAEKGAAKAADAVETTAKRTGEGVERGVAKVKRGAKKAGAAVKRGAQKAKAAVTPASAAN